MKYIITLEDGTTHSFDEKIMYKEAANTLLDAQINFSVTVDKGITEATVKWRQTQYTGYIVSSEGKVTNPDGDFLNTFVDKDGRTKVIITANGFEFKERVDELVLLAFTPTDSMYLMPHHVNGLRHDNRLSNLIWIGSRNTL